MFLIVKMIFLCETQGDVKPLVYLLSLCAGVLLAALVPAANAQDTFEPRDSPLHVTAQRTNEPIHIDGLLDEADWLLAEPAYQFRQINPDQGAPATFDTEVRVLYDDRYLYIGAICHEPAGTDGIRAPDLRRDFDFFTNDVFGVVIDTFGDGRLAAAFEVNPFGAQRDLLVTDGVSTDLDWDSVWRARTNISDSVWTVEMAIPWSTLRYASGSDHAWSINFVRLVRRTNELSGWSTWPRAYTPYRTEYAGRLHGIEPPPPSTNIRVQPYFVYRANRLEQSDRDQFATDLTPHIGIDAKWAASTNTVFDFTLNTDFAQADVDHQVVNFSRFDPYFPERRQFFLENAGLFSTGWSRRIEPFFSRTIGLDPQGRPLPIDAGGRFTSRTTTNAFGGMVIRQRGIGEGETSTFGVARYSQNLGTTSRVGGMIASRFDENVHRPHLPDPVSPSESNTVAAVDAFVRPTPALTLRGMLSRSFTSGIPDMLGYSGDGYAGYWRVTHSTNQAYLNLLQAVVENDYHAAAGFVARYDMILTSPEFLLDVRPAWRPAAVRSFNPRAVAFIIHRASDRRLQEVTVWLQPLYTRFHSGAEVTVVIEPEWQRVDHPLPIMGTVIDPGTYSFAQYGVAIQPDASRSYLGALHATTGGFYGGTRHRIVFQTSPIASPRVGTLLSYEGNWLRNISSNNERLTTHLLRGEFRFSLSPALHVTTVFQYNTHLDMTTWNARFAYEVSPLSYIYLVLNDNNRTAHRSPILNEQWAILKLTYLHQF